MNPNLLTKEAKQKDGFFKLVSVIFNHGYQKEWPPPDERAWLGSDWKRMVTYFNGDEYKYWVMSTDIEDITLINRAKINE